MPPLMANTASSAPHHLTSNREWLCSALSKVPVKCDAGAVWSPSPPWGRRGGLKRALNVQVGQSPCLDLTSDNFRLVKT